VWDAAVVTPFEVVASIEEHAGAGHIVVTPPVGSTRT